MHEWVRHYAKLNEKPKTSNDDMSIENDLVRMENEKYFSNLE